MNELEARIQKVLNDQGYMIARDFNERRIGEVVGGIMAEGWGQTSAMVVIGIATHEEFVRQCRKYSFGSEEWPYYYKVTAE